MASKKPTADADRPRVTVVPSEYGMPSLDELKARLRLRTRALRPAISRKVSTYELERRAKRMLEAKQPAALQNIKSDRDRLQISRLARTGGMLAGPVTVHDVDELVAKIHVLSPWMREVSIFLMRHLRTRMQTQMAGLVFPPVLLVGPPAVGKSAFARAIAKEAGIPMRRIDAGSGSAGFRISGIERGWGTSEPGVPVQTVLDTCVANPMMIVDEVDKAGAMTSSKGTSTSLVTSMLEHLERSSGAAFECPAYRIRFDLSHVNWLLTANDLPLVPAPLRSRCTVFFIPKPSPAQLLQVYDALMCDIEDRELVTDGRRILETLGDEMDLRQVHAFASRVRAEADVQPLH